MGDSSGGEPSHQRITELKVLIEKTKEQYQKSNPNDDRWPCPFCFVISKTKIQCNIHITKDHSHILKSNKNGFFPNSYVENRRSQTEYKDREENSEKPKRQKLERKCKNRYNSRPSETENTPDELTKFLKIVEEEYTDINELSNNLERKNE